LLTVLDRGTFHPAMFVSFIAIVLFLMFVCPIASICADRFVLHSSLPIMLLVGKWFVFWVGGIRLGAAGLRQFFQPRFTAEKIFGITANEPLPFIRELGAANIATGVAGVLSLYKPAFVFPMAIVAAIFFGLAGARHLTDSTRTQIQNVVMITDIVVSLVLIAYVGSVLLGSAGR
jgi:hypothetical protein